MCMEERGFLVLIGVVFSFIIDSISIPMVVLLILIILDYILGIAAAIKNEKKVRSVKGHLGSGEKNRVCDCHSVCYIS